MHAYTFGHLKRALETAIKHANEIGTNEDINTAKYALKLLMLEDNGYCSAGEQKWGNENEDEMNEWGHD